MAYIGKVKLAELAPNHPFAHSQISFGVKPPVSSSGKSKTPNKPEPSANPPLPNQVPDQELEPAEDSIPPA
jgi:hypothetical protein